MIHKLLFIALFSAMAFSASAQQSSAQNCPKPVQGPAIYPPQAVKNNISGEAIVAGRFDDCGRITEVIIRKKSGNSHIDNASVKAMKLTVLSESQRSKAIDGYYEMVFSFGVNNDMKIKPFDWPKTHQSPLYVVDADLIDFKSVSLANEAIKESDPNVLRNPIYNFDHRFVQFDAPTGREFWLFISTNGSVTVAARYRPVLEKNQPVVKLAMLCELEPNQCSAVRDILMRGLSFAQNNDARVQ